MQRLIADGDLAGMRKATEPGEKLWFQGDHVQTAEAQR